MQRWQSATLYLVMIVLLSLQATAQGQATSETKKSGALAILVRNPDKTEGQPPYALTDQYGHIQRLVEPTPGVALERHVGGRVRILHDTGKTLLASQLELPGALPSETTRELREVSPAQFVPPRRAERIDTGSRRRGRQYAVAPAQLTEGRYDADDPTEPIDLDSVIDDERADSLPSPTGGDRLEPIPAEQYYPEAVTVEPIHSGHDPDCPHCREKMAREAAGRHTVEHIEGGSCPHCNTMAAPVATRCQTCGGAPSNCGPTCNPASRRGVYGRADYMLWWFDGMGTPPLATTNSLGNAPILGQPGTRIVHQGELLDDARSGLRLTLGAWLDNNRDIAIEGDWLRFETASDTFAYNDPTGAGNLGRPFYNVAPIDPLNPALTLPPADDVQLIAFDGQVGGNLNIYARSQLKSLGLRLRTGICCREIGGGCSTCACSSCSGGAGGLLASRGSRPTAISRIDFIGGYRFMELEERLAFNESITDIASGAGVSVNEAFDTDNEFHGVDLGFVYDWQSTRWGLELTSKIAVGGTRQSVSINGVNSAGIGTATVTTPGGLLAQTSNIGAYKRDRFSVLPELSARLSYRITPQLRLTGGYTLLYWANVVRPGDAIDFSVDGRLASPATTTSTAYSHPRFEWEETSLWAHGLNLGVDYQY